MEANRGEGGCCVLRQQFSIVFTVIIVRNVNAAQARKQHIFLNKKAVDDGGWLAKVYSTKAKSSALLSGMMINDCHEFTITARKFALTHEFNKKSFFIFFYGILFIVSRAQKNCALNNQRRVAR